MFIPLGICIFLWSTFVIYPIVRSVDQIFENEQASQDMIFRGLYKQMRNPVYVGIIIALLGEAMFFQSFLLVGYTLVVLVCMHLWVILSEEPFLNSKYGSLYQSYCRQVPRWIPDRLASPIELVASGV